MEIAEGLLAYSSQGGLPASSYCSFVMPHFVHISRQRQLAEPERDQVITALNAVDTGSRKVARFANKTIDLSADAFDMAGSAARAAVRFVEDIMEGPSNAISGGTEQQKREANAIASAREQAKGSGRNRRSRTSPRTKGAERSHHQHSR